MDCTTTTVQLLITEAQVNLEIDNLLKWVLFNIVSGQITSDAL